jgi:hypothetical protein
MRWIGSGNFCGRDEKWTNILVRKMMTRENIRQIFVDGTLLLQWVWT